MPNQRASNKKQFGVTLTKHELNLVDATARALSITRTEFIRRATLGLVTQVQSESRTKNIVSCRVKPQDMLDPYDSILQGSLALPTSKAALIATPKARALQGKAHRIVLRRKPRNIR